MLRRAICAWMLLASSAMCTAQTKTKVFDDATFGVSFHYPSAWKLGPFDQPMMLTYGSTGGSEDVPGPLAAMMVSKETGNFQASGNGLFGYFRYGAMGADDAKGCTKRFDGSTGATHLMIHGVDYLLLADPDGDPVSDLRRRMIVKDLAAYRDGVCYLFEEHLVWGSDWEAAHTLAVWGHINAMRSELDAMMQSVVLGRIEAGSMQSYHNVKDGVSFRYPANWNSNVGSVMGSGLGNADIDEARPAIGQEILGSNGLTHEDIFYYTVFSGLNEAACHKKAVRLADDDNGDKTDEKVFNAIHYTHVSNDDAGLGHGRSSDIYVTFQRGQCYAFETADSGPLEDQPGNPPEDVVGRMAKEMDAIMATVRFDTP